MGQRIHRIHCKVVTQASGGGWWLEREIAGENTLENFILYTEENSLETTCNEASFIIFFLGKSTCFGIVVFLHSFGQSKT